MGQCTAGNGTSRIYTYSALSVFCTILPFMEHANIYDLYDKKDNSLSKLPPGSSEGKASNSVFVHSLDLPCNAEELPAWQCPSEIYRTYPGYYYTRVTGRSYVVCTGDWPETFDSLLVDNSKANPRWQDKHFVDKGYEKKAGGPNRRTAFGLIRCKNLADIHDGTSNTVAMGEGTRGTSDKAFTTSFDHTTDKRTVRETVVFDKNFSHLTRTESPDGYDVTSVCLNPALRSVNAREWDESCSVRSDRGGVYAFSALPQYSTFQTMLPPNAPACQGNDRRLTPLSSYHSGGGNVCMFDGSVRFISDTINTASTSIAKVVVSTGPSGYGVWGALGSINGGEVPAL